MRGKWHCIDMKVVQAPTWALSSNCLIGMLFQDQQESAPGICSTWQNHGHHLDIPLILSHTILILHSYCLIFNTMVLVAKEKESEYQLRPVSSGKDCPFHYTMEDGAKAVVGVHLKTCLKISIIPAFPLGATFQYESQYEIKIHSIIFFKSILSLLWMIQACMFNLFHLVIFITNL